MDRQFLMRLNFSPKLLAVIFAVSTLHGCEGTFASRQTGIGKPDVKIAAGVSGLDDDPLSSEDVQRLPLSELPKPFDDGERGYAAFTNYVERLAAEANHTPHMLSALIDPKSLATLPRRVDCNGQPLAVVIDLDPGPHSLDLSDPPFPMPGLADQLDRMRKIDVSVLWATGLNSRYRGAVESRLAAVGLTLSGQDRVLLTATDMSKADAKRAAARQFCILAIAGDQLGDFDEAFVYLKDKNGTIGSMLLSNIGNGWFFAELPTQ